MTIVRRTMDRILLGPHGLKVVGTLFVLAPLILGLRYYIILKYGI